MNRNDLEDILIKEFNIKEGQILENLFTYYSKLESASKVMNLTAIVGMEESYIKHFYDSLLISKTLDLTGNLRVLDIGSGAGFPGLVLKIVYKNLDITLVEPTLKRCNFLNDIINTLNLKNIKVINKRAEDYIENERDKFDLVTARAVAPLNILLELCVPFVKISGKFCAMKGSNYEEELENSTNALSKLKLVKHQNYQFNLPLNYGFRAIMVFTKEQKTPIEYPRLYTKIKKNPL